MKEMHRRGIRILPGGDYSFAWAPHGSYSRDLVHFVNIIGFTSMELIIAATALGGEIIGHPDVLGKILPDYYADIILVNSDPLKDISILQDTRNLRAIVINRHIHKNSELGASIPRPAEHLPVRVVPKGESLILTRGRKVKNEPNGDANGHAQINGNSGYGKDPSNEVNNVLATGKKQVGWFDYGVVEDNLGISERKQNGELSGVSAEVVKGL